MSDGLSNFLVDLASDPQQMARFLVSPSAGLDGFTLTTEEQEALIARDAHELRRLLLRDRNGNGNNGVAGRKGNGGVAGRKKPRTRRKPYGRRKPARKRVPKKK